MNSITTEFADHIKKESQKLLLAFKLIIPPTDCLSQLEPSFKTPTLQQCNEILAHAHGFNTFNGLKVSSDNRSSFQTALFNQSLKSFLLRENVKASTGLVSMIELVQKPEVLSSFIEEINLVYNLLNGFPSLLNFKLPERFYAKEFIFDWSLPNSPYKLNTEKEAALNLFLSLLIENIDSLDFFTFENSVVYSVPLAYLYQHKIHGLNKVKDLVIDLEDLFNATGIVKIASGLLDFNDFRMSQVDVVMSSQLSDMLLMISRLIKNQNIALSKLNSVLDVYLNHYGTAFRSRFDVAMLDESPNKKLKGIDVVRYQLNKRLYFMALMNQLNLKSEAIYATNDKVNGRLHINDVDQKLMLHSIYINDAITQFDDKYAQVILPFINEYIKAQGSILDTLKPHITAISEHEGSNTLPEYVKQQLHFVYDGIIDSVSKLPEKLNSD